MHPELQTVANYYALGPIFIQGLVGDFTDADWRVTDPAGHDPRWIMGHLATYRRRAAGMLGAPQPAAAWEEHFVRGTSAADLPADLDPRELVAAFQAAHEAMLGRWDLVSREELAKPLGRTLPDGTSTVGDAVRFMAYHEAYHLGQLGLLRRIAGKPGRA
jgi:hypothetical protein